MLVTIADTETGGLRNEHSVLSVGAIVGNLDTGKVLDGFESLVKLPDYNVTPKAMEINGLDLAQCMEEGQPPEEVGQLLVDLHTKHGAGLIGGHNFAYDERMLCANIFEGCDSFEFDAMFGYRKVDSCSVIRMLQGLAAWGTNINLSKAAKYMKIDMSDFDKLCGPMFMYKPRRSGFHGALFDSLASFRVLAKFRQVLARQENFALLTE